MQQFELILKNEKIKMYRTIAWIFLLLNFAFFVLLIFVDEYRYPALAFIVALGLYLLMRWYLFKQNKATFLLDEFVFFIPAAGWFGMHSYLMAVGCLLMGILFRLSMQKIKFVFARGVITKANFPRREFEWNAFNNVLLKDNILTLDFANNKLMQAQIENYDAINETEFNSFAQQQINKSKNPVQ